MTLGPHRQLVLPKLIGRREVTLPGGAGAALILTIYKWDRQRFLLNGFDPLTQRIVDLVLMEEHFTEDQEAQLDHCRTPEVLFDFFVGSLCLRETEGSEKGSLKLVLQE